MSSASSQEAIQQLSSEYMILREIAQGLEQRINLLNQVLQEIESSLNTLEDLKRVGDNPLLLFPIGGSVYAKGQLLEKDDVYVNVGAGVIVKKKLEDASRYLTERRDEMRAELKDSLAQLQQVTARIRQIEAILSRATGEQG